MSLQREAERLAVVIEARSWIGTPYRSSCGVKHAGVDCAYLLLRVFNHLGFTNVKLPPFYKPGLSMYKAGEHLYQSIISSLFVPSRSARPEPGDVVVFRVPFGRHVRLLTHGGIVTFWPMVVHAYNGVGVIEERATSTKLCANPETFWTLPRWL